jgi:hypothetical protein
MHPGVPVRYRDSRQYSSGADMLCSFAARQHSSNERAITGALWDSSSIRQKRGLHISHNEQGIGTAHTGPCRWSMSIIDHSVNLLSKPEKNRLRCVFEK